MKESNKYWVLVDKADLVPTHYSAAYIIMVYDDHELKDLALAIT